MVELIAHNGEQIMANRLANESSPYLLQHKNNPVKWFPWGKEALELAETTDKPIFLSIGYSACHWCHVMEHESFENKAIAQILNENFVNIKVDREERPDLDQIYMNAVMALRNGQGGWPLSVFLTPDQDVFFGGTYWPPTSRVGMPGFDHVLLSVLDAFTNRREQVNEQSREITKWLNQAEESVAQPELNYQPLIDAAVALHRNFDFDNGGFGAAPKFPHAMDLALLVRLSKNWPEEAPLDRDVLLEMVRVNLKKMAYGGIFDHLAGGFARYSVDEFWLVPHFEKMLYDNALLAEVYLDMFRTTGDQFYAMIARKTLNYLLEYMIDEKGGFHSTEDADSEGVEGKFYVWSKSEVFEALGATVGERFCELYNVTESGNFEGSNILNMTLSYRQFADQFEMEKEELRDEMRQARKSLLQIRDRRIRPGKDDKVLVSWNALAISAFAKAALILNDEKYLHSARSAANFVLKEMVKGDGRLLHTWRNGSPKIDAFLDDYSYLINALLDLYDVCFEHDLLTRACELTEDMLTHFGASDGAFFFTADDQETLIARQKSFQDSSVPSGNSMAALGLLRLGRILGKLDWIEKAQRTISASQSLIDRSPLAAGQMLIAMHEALTETIILVVVSDSDLDLDQVKTCFTENKGERSVLLCQNTKQKPEPILEGLLTGKLTDIGETTLYECVGNSCSPPISGLTKVLERLQNPASS